MRDAARVGWGDPAKCPPGRALMNNPHVPYLGADGKRPQVPRYMDKRLMQHEDSPAGTCAARSAKMMIKLTRAMIAQHMPARHTAQHRKSSEGKFMFAGIILLLRLGVLISFAGRLSLLPG